MTSAYDQGAADGWRDREDSFNDFFRFLLDLSETRKTVWLHREMRWAVRVEGRSYSDYKTGYMVAFMGANPHGF